MGERSSALEDVVIALLERDPSGRAHLSAVKASGARLAFALNSVLA